MEVGLISESASFSASKGRKAELWRLLKSATGRNGSSTAQGPGGGNFLSLRMAFIISAPSLTSSIVKPTTTPATTDADAWPMAQALG